MSGRFSAAIPRTAKRAPTSLGGSTDEFGFAAQENPTSINDLHATILHLLGINHAELTYRYAGRDFRLTDVYGEGIRPLVV